MSAKTTEPPPKEMPRAAAQLSGDWEFAPAAPPWDNPAEAATARLLRKLGHQRIQVEKMA